jgi:1-deoxy-D-xylulose-5-phosphate synthase
METTMSILESISGPADVRRLRSSALPDLCEEIRALITETVLRNGGHLASSLGAVELVVALLRAFDFSKDKLLFDVGHQAYAYKILTCRRERFSTLRTWDGVSGYPKRSESVFDHFDVGHSSTSLSAALGYAKARDLLGQDHYVVAVIGDGSLLNGMAMEALNCAREADTRVLFILNDNEMSINRRVGGLAEHLARLSVHPAYLKLKEMVKEQCRMLPKGESLESVLGRVKSQVKTILQPSNFFEDLGLSYWGPFDGHDPEELEDILRLAKLYEKPLLLHVITKKGKGYPAAEKDPARFHGISPSAAGGSRGETSWSAAAAEVAEAMAESDPGVVCLTAAMMEGTKLASFAKRFPERFFDVGIAEEHMVTFAAGMAAGGLRPLVFIYSTFLQRAMDQLVHDTAMQGYSVLFALDRAGLVGEDGETHHGVLDVAWCRAVPGLTLAAPRDRRDLEFLFSWAHRNKGPLVVRYPRGCAPAEICRTPASSACAPWGHAEILFEGTEWACLGFGSTIPLLLEARALAEERNIPMPTVVDLRFLKPLDEALLQDVLARHRLAVVAEEGSLAGGIGEAGAELGGRLENGAKVRRLGVPDAYIPQGTPKEQRQYCGLTAENVLGLFYG